MRHLFSLQALIICLTGLLPVLASGQHNKGNNNFRAFQDKGYYFGLTLGFNKSNFQLMPSSQFILNDSFNITEGQGGGGFNLSLVANMKLGEYFDFRFLPGFSFANRKFFYVNAVNEVEQTRSVESVFMQFPLQLRFKSDPFHDIRVFVLAGAKYTYDLASTAVLPEQAKRLIRISPHDYAVEVGAGCQFFFPFFIFSPEIKYSQGIGNILIHNSNLSQSTVLEKVLSRTFTISFHFEG